MNYELKVKAINLGDEARTIKRFEKKLLDTAWYANWQVILREQGRSNGEFQRELEARRDKARAGFDKLHQHRIHAVRPEARATNIARGFLRGLVYEEIETNPCSTPNWASVARMVSKYGTLEQRTQFEAWRPDKDPSHWMYIKAA
jgi:hypothetical protein